MINVIYNKGYVVGGKKLEAKKGVRYFPIALFASVMGLSGVAMSLRLIENIYNMSHLFSNIVVLIATIVFMINAIILIYRFIFFFNDIKMDFKHPVKMNFYGAIAISLLLLGTLYYDLNESISFVVWGLGVLMQTSLTLFILTRLIWYSSFKLAEFNPSWFIPIVGNIVVPLGGVYHVDLEINWIFYGIGIVFSIIYITLTFIRLFFHEPIQPPLLPMLFILLAPPGIGLVSYVKLTGSVDVFAHILYGFAFYLGLLFIIQFKRFFLSPFFISWWAYLFPSAAVTNATIYMYIETNYYLYKPLFIIQIIGLIILTVYTLSRTIHLATTGVLFKEGPP